MINTMFVSIIFTKQQLIFLSMMALSDVKGIDTNNIESTLPTSRQRDRI